MLMMRAPAVRIMRSRPRAEAASSNLLALHRTDQKPAPTPHGMRARFAAIHQLISSFRVVPTTPRITSISGTPATQRSRVGGNGVFFIKASPLRLRQALAAQSRAHRRGTLRCPISWLPPMPPSPKPKVSGGRETRSVALHRKTLNP